MDERRKAEKVQEEDDMTEMMVYETWAGRKREVPKDAVQQFLDRMQQPGFLLERIQQELRREAVPYAL